MPHECTTCGRVFADGSKQMLSGCPDCGGNKFQFKPTSATKRDEPPMDAADRNPESGGVDPTGRAGTGSTETATTDSTETATTDSTETATTDSTETATTDPTGPPGDRNTAPGDSTETRRDLSADSTEWPDHGYGTAGDSGSDDSSPDASAVDDPAAETPVTDASATGPDAAAESDVDGSGTSESTSDSGSEAGESTEDPAQADARTDVVSPDEIAAATPETTDGTANPDAPGSPATRTDDPAGSVGGQSPGARPDDRPDLHDLREELNEQFESIRIVAPGEYELNLMELYDRTEYIISLQEDGRYIIEVPDTWDTTPDSDEM
ncbi:OapC/ArvC family zinc-ribbon domain-containing protein [Halobellus salinus]|uniref:OapC/ArvC family zinc-ribbon domain-containing protein n=1 Tax=Halobellus salinus TaxID=931585 RepID=UPI00240343E3|nr:Zn-ribbon containing protein [Halobellus salinus]SMP25840.1 hypothetical protein SAMN06265347_11124 [Halobellus salinus]